MRIGLRHVAAVLAISTALVGCGSSGGSPSAATGSPFASPTPSIRSSGLTAQLLTVADLPAGWAVDPSPRKKIAQPPCIAGFKVTVHATGKAEARFVNVGTASFFDEVLRYYDTSARAGTAFSDGVARLDRCHAIAFVDRGITFRGTIRRLSPLLLGQRSAVWQVVLTGQSLTLGFDALAVQKGREIAFTGYGGLGVPDLAMMKSLGTKTVAKMAAS